jgi:hypothetical protein
VAEKRCGLCCHYKVSLSGEDRCRLLEKKVRSLDRACEQYSNEILPKSIESSVAVKKSCAEGEC